MELNNFEQQVKEKLSNREITPSAQAWGRLDAMLSVQEKPKKKMTWWYVAASVTGLLLVGTLFFNTSKESNVITPSQEIVVTSTEDKDSVTLKPSIEPTNEVSVQPKSVLATNVSKVANNQNTNTKNTHQELSINNQITTTNNQTSTTIEKSTEHQAIAAIDEKVQVAPTVVPKKQKIQVDPSTLLSQVDGELELSFREKVIAKVNKNYQTVKVALANRNNQE
ncbi:hypothetical protein SAMN05444143_101651 [Flavobacterium succinicans]|uniref:Uncharacterized protein n=1 Tax=Flavobacterium succinicans TaxID=29536 RepID=A0A1I4S3F4_9FLAO|nr:hypothetical protein [Flavobacterium succinicans]SFM59056.1 hypothetical protein SAMN05444143_101651 [Flavobacterium succinicans]